MEFVLNLRIIIITYLEFFVGVTLVTHHGAGARGEDGVSVEINHPVVATRKQVPR